MSVFIAVLLASAQTPTTTQPAPVAPATEAPKAKQKKVCKSDDLISGSRMARRICLTEDEWAKRDSGMTQSARSGYSGKAEDH